MNLVVTCLYAIVSFVYLSIKRTHKIHVNNTDITMFVAVVFVIVVARNFSYSLGINDCFMCSVSASSCIAFGMSECLSAEP